MNPTAAHAKNGEHRGYPGAKNAPGVWHTIINNIPPHDCFVECFAGSAVITRKKRSATSTIVIESDAAACESLRRRNWGTAVDVVRADAVAWLAKNHGSFSPRTVVYCDPPYLWTVRSAPGRRYYNEEFGRAWQHEVLLKVLLDLKVPCLVSGRRDELYDRLLADWRRVDYSTRTHGGNVTESLWCNFPEPDALHDYRFLGSGFRERERIKRKLARWCARFAKMPILERRLVFAALAKTGEAGLTDPIATNGEVSCHSESA